MDHIWRMCLATFLLTCAVVCGLLGYLFESVIPLYAMLLLILIGVVVGGNMFGILGILLAIPVVAILDLVYNSYFMPWLEKNFFQLRHGLFSIFVS